MGTILSWRLSLFIKLYIFKFGYTAYLVLRNITSIAVAVQNSCAVLPGIEEVNAVEKSKSTYVESPSLVR